MTLAARTLSYDSAGRLIWSIQPSGQTTAFSYDSNGNIEATASITPAEDQDADGMPDYFEIRFTGDASGLVATEDADLDGMINLFEFAFAKDPTVSDSQYVTYISNEGTDPQTGEPFTTLKYLRPTSGPLHLNYSTQISFDMSEWLTDPPDVEETNITPVEGGFEEVTVKFSPATESNERFFMRIIGHTL